jgi:hypothetical protein
MFDSMHMMTPYKPAAMIGSPIKQKPVYTNCDCMLQLEANVGCPAIIFELVLAMNAMVSMR